MTLHSSLGPSGFHRWGTCAGSRHAEAMHGEGRSSIYAAEGTVFHFVAASCLEFGLDPVDFLDKTFECDGYEFVFDETFVRNMQPGLAKVRELLVGTEHFFELRVDISEWTDDDQFGTTDIAAINVAKAEIIIGDWKYGAGVPVEAQRNGQTGLYALGFWNTAARFRLVGIDPKDITVRMFIFQPRVEGEGGEWVTTLAELMEFGREIKKLADRTKPINAPRTPGEHTCQFCKAKHVCEARAAWAMDKMASKFDVLDEADEFGLDPALPVYGDLTIEQRVQVAKHAAAMINWIKEVHTGVLRDALAGEPTPGMKAIAGRRGKRAWTDESAAVEVMEASIGERAYSRKPISPAQAEKQLPKEAWESLKDLISQPEGRPSLVDENHPKPALVGYVDKFDDITVETE